MSISPHFVSLSLCVSSRAWGDSPNLSMMDCLAWAIERESDPVDLPQLVERSVSICERAARDGASLRAHAAIFRESPPDSGLD